VNTENPKSLDLAKVGRIRKNFQETWLWSMVDIEYLEISLKS
jgi:hypothetical protein